MRHPTHIFESFFHWLGYKIGSYPYQVIALCLLSALLMSGGLVRFGEVNNVRTEYSPRTSPSRREYEVAKGFLKQNGTMDPCYIMVRARDGGNLLRDRYRNLLYNMTRALQTEVVVRKNGRIYSFNEICEPYCDMNTALLAFLKLYDPHNPNTFTYPTIQFFGTRLFIGNNVYGVKLKEPPNSTDSEGGHTSSTEDLEAKALASTIGLGGSNHHLESFTTAIMPFFMVASVEDTDVLIEWQRKAIALFERHDYSRWLKTGMTGDHLVSYEVRRMGIETAPLIIGSIAAMIVFVVTTSFRVNPVLSKPWEALAGCLIPLLAILAALGVMSMFELRFQSIMVAALFLIIAVGVDDIFMLLSAWHRTSPLAVQRCDYYADYAHDSLAKLRSKPKSSLLISIPERMAVALEEAGPSITISSATNVMSFAIGVLSSDTPAVRSFCIFAAVAITICWFYQLVLLAAIVALSGRREASQRQSLLCCLRADPTARCRLVEWGERLHHWVVRTWAAAVTSTWLRLTIAVLMLYYFYISWVGIGRLSTNISIDKMALQDSYLHDFQHSFESALRNMQPIWVFVLEPGDLRQPGQMQRIKSLVQEFEHSLNAYGAETTFFWLPQYEDFLRFYSGFNEDDDSSSSVPTGPGHEFQQQHHSHSTFTYTEIPAFFKSATYYYLSSFVHINASACAKDEPACLQSFFFTTNFHEVIKYHELVPTVTDWRRIASKYSDLRVFAYSDHTPFVDQTIAIDQTVYGSVAAALICTAAICLLFIPHLLSVVCAVFSVFSVSWGVFGLLSLWGVDLDPLSMAALIMAIGFSVDFTAHISYHYYKAPAELSPRERIESSLGVIGWPMLQVGLSTIVGLLPLLIKQSYLALVFLKTIVVVVLLGMFHGLIILPAVLTLFTRQQRRASTICPMGAHKAGSYGRNSEKSSPPPSIWSVPTLPPPLRKLGSKTHITSSDRAESGFGSGASSSAGSAKGDSGDSSSEGGSQRLSSTGGNRSATFYRNQQFVKFFNDLGIFHLPLPKEQSSEQGLPSAQIPQIVFKKTKNSNYEPHARQPMQQRIIVPNRPSSCLDSDNKAELPPSPAKHPKKYYGIRRLGHPHHHPVTDKLPPKRDRQSRSLKRQSSHPTSMADGADFAGSIHGRRVLGDDAGRVLVGQSRYARDALVHRIELGRSASNAL